MKHTRIFGFLALALLCIILLPAKAEAATVAEGVCGDDATWVLDDTCTLTITGSGAIFSYYDWDNDDAPWYEHRNAIVKVVVDEGITHIGYRAFYNCANLTAVELPDTLISIGGGAFSQCGLTEINLPEGLKSIEGSAFYGCTSLESVVIPDSVESVYVGSFFDCTALKEVTIGAGVTMLGPQVFKNCTALEKVYFNAVNMKDLARYHDTFYNAGVNGPGITMVIGKDVTRIPGSLTHSREKANVTELVFEEGSVCTAIGWNSFPHSNIQVLEFPSSVQQIESDAFTDSSNLTRVTIPDSVNTLGYMTFYSCTSLKQVTVGKGLEQGIREVFQNCPSLEAIHIDTQNATYYSDAKGVVFSKDRDTLVFLPQGIGSEYTVPSFVKTIGELSIAGNHKLTKLIIPGNVVKIETGGVSTCHMLTTVELSEGLLYIGNNAFSGNQSLTRIIIPDSVLTVGNNAFDMCDSLSGAHIGKGVRELGDEVFGFYGVQNSITVDSENQYYCSANGGLYTKDKTTLITVVRKKNGRFEVAEGVKTIEAFCFYGCKEITGIILPDSLVSIGSNAFNDCSALTEIELPEGLKTLGDAVFVSCRKLVQMRIPDGVEVIGGSLFHGCECLEAVTFGTGVKKIWWNLFYDCVQLDALIFTGNAPEIEGDAFSGVTATAYYPGADSSWTEDKLCYYGGYVTWVPVLEQVDQLRLTTPAVLTDYVVGESVDLSQVGMEALSAGQWINVPYRLWQVDHVDMTTAGRKTLRVTYGGKTVQLTVVVHEAQRIEVDPGLYPESSHNYESSLDQIKVLTVEGAEKVILTFSARTQFENYCDKLQVLDGNDQMIAEFTGQEAAGLTLEVLGDTVKLRLITDGSVTYYGYSFSNIYGQIILHPGETGQNKAPGCTENGYENAVYCQICQGPVGDNILPALGHEYEQTVTKPAPGKQGCTTHICIRCGVSYTDGYTDYETLSGQCGDNVSWQLDNAGVLQITGTGPMDNYSNGLVRSVGSAAPWSEYAAYIRAIVVDGGVTAIGSNAFYACSNVTAARIGAAVEAIGSGAFAGCEDLENITFTGSAPTIAADAFGGVHAVAVYPSGDSSWTGMENYAGSLAWGSDADQVAVMGDQVYNTFAEALAAYKGNTYLKLLADAQVDVVLTCDLYIDLNGFDLSGRIVTGGYKVYGMDSTTNGYSCDSIGYFNCVDENGQPVVPVAQFRSSITGTAKRYMAIKNENSWSFHRFYLGLTHVSIRPTTTGVGYKAVFWGDPMVAASLDSFGFTMCLEGNAPITVLLSGEKFVSGKVITLRIDNYDVELYGEAELSARVMLKLADGTVIESNAATMTLRGLLEQLNSSYAALATGHRAVIADMIKKYAIIQSWKVENLMK